MRVIKAIQKYLGFLPNHGFGRTAYLPLTLVKLDVVIGLVLAEEI